MQDFVDITINDKQLFDKYFKTYNPQASELTFTNLFMWRDYYRLTFAEIYGFLCIVSNADEGEPFAFVPIKGSEADNFDKVTSYLKEYFTAKGWEMKFKRITESEIPLFGADFSAEFDPDSSDYVYLTSDLINLLGKRYDGKRNHINKFKKKYEYEYVVIDDDNIKECYKIMDAWCAERNCEEHKGFYCEKLANNQLLTNFKTLGCKGALIKVDGEFKAFTIGGILNNDTVVIHIEKADSKVDGLYTFINQKFCETEWGNVTYVNREQDLGVEGLRKAKLSYHPTKMVNKYVVELK